MPAPFLIRSSSVTIKMYLLNAGSTNFDRSLDASSGRKSICSPSSVSSGPTNFMTSGLPVIFLSFSILLKSFVISSEPSTPIVNCVYSVGHWMYFAKLYMYAACNSVYDDVCAKHTVLPATKTITRGSLKLNTQCLTSLHLGRHFTQVPIMTKNCNGIGKAFEGQWLQHVAGNV